MGMDISCIGGIGFEISELLSMYEDHKLTKDYYSDDEDYDKEEILDSFVEDTEHIKLSYLHSYDDTEYYLFTKDPIKGVQDFIDELIKLGFEDLNIDDLEFHSNAKVW